MLVNPFLFKKGFIKKIDIALEPKKIELAVAEVRPDKKEKNQAKPLMQRVIDAKKTNDPKRIGAVAHKFHEKLELDWNGIPEKLPTRKFWGPFSWVWDKLDSTEARINLPLFMSESIGHKRTQSKPLRSEKRVQAIQSTWIQDAENSSAVSAEFFDIDFYSNQFLLLDKGFTSPLHNRYNLHYRYYILDTLDVGGRPNFHIAFVPRRRGEYTFEGELWIDTLTLGLKKVEAKISEGASFNFLRSMNFMLNYELIDGNWVRTLHEDVLDVSISGNSQGVYARNSITYYDFEFAEEWPDEVWGSRRDMSYEDGAYDVTDEEWEELRPQVLSYGEKDIYHTADSVQSMPQYNFLSGLLYCIGSGYVELDKIEIGPWYDAYSFNAVEGNRFGLELYTTDEVSRSFMPSVFLAYGTLDKEFKYGADITFVQSRTPWIEWNISHQKDIDQLGMMGYFDQGNIFNSALSVNGIQNQLSMVTTTEASFMGEFGSGFTSLVELRHRKVDPRGELQFQNPDDPSDENPAIITAESTFQLRYAKNEKFISGSTERYNIGTRAPIFTLTTTQGWKGIAGSQYRYGRYTFGIEGVLRMGPLGRIRYDSELGTYSGEAPFPLLELPPANETVLSIRNSFNLMNYFEFVTDTWARGVFEWNGEGMILDRIPLIRRLELREIIGVKGVYGQWDDRHESILELPEGTTGLDGFYGEAVIGLGNIFHFIRVDFNMKLAHRSSEMRENWGVRVGVAVEL